MEKRLIEIIVEQAKHSKKNFQYSKKVFKKGRNVLTKISKISLRRFFKEVKNNSTSVIVYNPDYTNSYCDALAGSMKAGEDLTEQEKSKLLVILTNILPIDPQLIFISKLTSEIVQIEAITQLMCKFHIKQIPGGADRIDILGIAIKLTSRLCR